MCLIGGLDDEGKPEDNFTGAQHIALTMIASAFRKEYPSGKIVGHRELKGYPHSLCPTLDMERVRTNVEAWIDNSKTLTQLLAGAKKDKPDARPQADASPTNPAG